MALLVESETLLGLLVVHRWRMPSEARVAAPCGGTARRGSTQQRSATSLIEALELVPLASASALYTDSDMLFDRFVCYIDY